jgi:cardiolipin synthase
MEVARRQHQQEPFAHRLGPAAFGAVKFAGGKFAELLHSVKILTKRPERSNLMAMLPEATPANCTWFRTGQAAFPAMLAAIESAREIVRLETYIYSSGPLGERFRDALVRARERGVRVKVLLDALGSYNLPAIFWKPLRAAGGEVREFNPLSLHRLGIRNHRKLLVCDGRVAFVGGFNIAEEYDGDGVTHGWCDLGLRLEGALAGELAGAFEEMFALAEFRHKHFLRLRKSRAKKAVRSWNQQLLLSGPGRGRSPIKKWLRWDLGQAASVQIMVGYFLPTWRIRRQLAHLARRGTRVQLMLAGKSDVALSQLAARSLYRHFLRAGIEIYEYQPQVLHAKLLVIGQTVYVGSANLDQRSLNINYELMLRFHSEEMARQARAVFEENLTHCRRITLEQWRESSSLWERLKQRWAYFLLMRLDPHIARRQWRGLPD